MRDIAGFDEIRSAFLACPGVDPGLVPDGWLCNHYRWVVWKLASMARRLPGVGGGLTPANVMMQLKLRYDRELDRVERPLLRKITEKNEPTPT